MAAQDLNAMAFPKLTEEQMAQLGRYAGASTKTFRAGEALFHAGDRDPKFFVIRSGELEIIDVTGDQPKTIRVQGPGDFTGDVGHLTGSPKVVSAIARSDCEVYEMSEAELRKVLNQDPELSDLILQAFIARRQLMRESPEFTGLRVIGSRYSRDTFRIRDFLAKNRVLFTWLDLEGDPAVNQLLQQFGVTEAETPIVACAHCLVLRNPSNRELAEKIGIRRPVEHTVYDLAIVGSGPAGLAAAVYGASEGLNTIVLEHTAPGGQAGSSMRIENYLGFPTGITGSELADRAVLQADKFGAEISIPTPVTKLTFDKTYSVLELTGQARPGRRPPAGSVMGPAGRTGGSASAARGSRRRTPAGAPPRARAPAPRRRDGPSTGEPVGEHDDVVPFEALGAVRGRQGQRRVVAPELGEPLPARLDRGPQRLERGQRRRPAEHRARQVDRRRAICDVGLRRRVLAARGGFLAQRPPQPSEREQRRPGRHAATR